MRLLHNQQSNLLFLARRFERDSLPTADSAQTQRSLRIWDDEVRDIVSAGKAVNQRLSRVLAEAKPDLPYGEWTKWWEPAERPFAVRKADKLVFVGERLTSLLPLDRAEVCLPSSLMTLYMLAHLPGQLALKLLSEGIIHRKLKCRQAEALLEKDCPQPKLNGRAFAVRPVIATILRKVRAMGRNAAPEDFAFATRKLEFCIHQLGQKTVQPRHCSKPP